MIARTNTTADAMRTGRARTRADTVLFVGKIFKLWGQLAYPPAIVQAADETTIALIARHIQKLLLRYQRSQPGQVRISAVAHDPTDHPGQLSPLPLRQRFAVSRDRHQQGSSGPGDCVGKELFRLGAGNDLAPGADDVGNPISAHPDDVAPAADSRAFEISGSCFHPQPNIVGLGPDGPELAPAARQLPRRRARAGPGGGSAPSGLSRSRPP